MSIRKRNDARTSRADGEATRHRILEVAGGLFAASGFAETTSKAIAAKAKVDLASINYHFGSRNGLYQTVLAEAHRQLISLESLHALAATNLPARGKLRKLIEGLAEKVVSNRGWHARVLGHELLSPTSHLQVLQQNEILPKIRLVLGILSEITGLPADDPALFRCLISIAAPCSMLLVAGRNLPAMAEHLRHTSPEELAAHLYHFAVGGLQAIRKQRGKHRPRKSAEA